MKNENNLNRGFAFLEFATKQEAQACIDQMNGQKYKGRTVVLELSLPKRKYEQKVQNIMENTKMKREDVIQPKVIRDEKEEAVKKKEEVKQQKLKEKEERKQVKQEPKEEKQTKTLFVRNIGFDTSQEEFKDFMSKFGALNYAVLCKQRDDPSVHKGSGFVSFKDPKAADQLLELSKQIEQKLD